MIKSSMHKQNDYEPVEHWFVLPEANVCQERTVLELSLESSFVEPGRSSRGVEALREAAEDWPSSRSIEWDAE